MITAVDTNILLDILVPNDQFYEVSGDALEEAAGQGSIVISDIVYAELCIHFETQRECDAFPESAKGADARHQTAKKSVALRVAHQAHSRVVALCAFL
jgi:predicted nucleic acid-binding protein